MDLASFIDALFSRFRRRSSHSPETPGHLRLGLEGELFAARHLRRHGYKILRRNFRARGGGEVDLVCRHRDTLVFVEVKTRRSDVHGAPSEAVTPQKQRFIAKGALAWLQMLDNPDILSRFDVVEVLIPEGASPRATIIENAFPLPEPYIT